MKYREDTIGFMSDCANQVFGESNIFYDVANLALSPDLPVGASFDEFLTDTMVLKNFAYCVKITRFNDEIKVRWLYY